MRFVADPSVERGQCILETDEGVIESSVADHLASVAEALKEPEA